MSSVNKIFYDDIANIIHEYLMMSVNDIKTHKSNCCTMIWNLSERIPQRIKNKTANMLKEIPLYNSVIQECVLYAKDVANSNYAIVNNLPICKRKVSVYNTIGRSFLSAHLHKKNFYLRKKLINEGVFLNYPADLIMYREIRKLGYDAMHMQPIPFNGFC